MRKEELGMAKQTDSWSGHLETAASKNHALLHTEVHTSLFPCLFKLF